MPNILLKCSDGSVIAVDVEIAKKSSMLKAMIEYFGDPKDGEKKHPTALPINRKYLFKCLEWSSHYLNTPEIEYGILSELSEWDQNFFRDLSIHEHFLLLDAANYLAMSGLRKVICKSIAIMIKKKTPKQIANTFHPKIKPRLMSDNVEDPELDDWRSLEEVELEEYEE